jgi:hypothetical protein
MGAAIQGKESVSRAQEMAALLPQDRNVLIAIGILSGTVVDGRRRFADAIRSGMLLTAPLIDFDDWWPVPPRGAA